VRLRSDPSAAWPEVCKSRCSQDGVRDRSLCLFEAQPCGWCVSKCRGLPDAFQISRSRQGRAHGRAWRYPRLRRKVLGGARGALYSRNRRDTIQVSSYLFKISEPYARPGSAQTQAPQRSETWCKRHCRQ